MMQVLFSATQLEVVVRLVGAIANADNIEDGVRVTAYAIKAVLNLMVHLWSR